jgi:hypothetical protein
VQEVKAVGMPITLLAFSPELVAVREISRVISALIN